MRVPSPDTGHLGGRRAHHPILVHSLSAPSLRDVTTDGRLVRPPRTQDSK